MNELGTGIILLAALGLAAVIAVRLHRAGLLPAIPAAGSPPGTSTVALGQWAVAPDRQWLLIQPGQ